MRKNIKIRGRENIRINRILFSKDSAYELDNVYLTVSVDNEPFHTVKSEPLTMVFRAEGKNGLYREIMRLLYSTARLEGKDKSLDRFYYALDKANKTDICNEYLDKANDLYYELSDSDKKILKKGYLNDNCECYKRRVEELKTELYSNVAQYCVEFDKNRIFDLYKNDIKKLAHNKIRRFNAIEYVCSFPAINPYDMAKSLVMEGYDINFDDSSITKEENIQKAMNLARSINSDIKTHIININPNMCTLKEFLSKNNDFSPNMNYFYRSWDGITFKEFLGMNNKDYKKFTSELSCLNNDSLSDISNDEPDIVDDKF